MESMYDKILKVSEELFMTRGYRKTSTRQIAQIVGITQPNLYHHFKNKEEIYLAMMNSLSEEVSFHLTLIRKSDRETFEKLQEMMLYLYMRHPFDIHTMMHDIHYNFSKETAHELYLLWKRTYVKPFQDLLLENKEILRSEIDIDSSVQFLFVLLSHFMKKGKTKEQFYNDIQDALHIFLYGIIDPTSSSKE